MLEKVIATALRQKFATLLLALVLAGAGFWAFQQLHVEAYPDISETQAVVVTQFPGHAAEEMEQQITVPIERVLNSVPNVVARRSRTLFGLSVVELTFDYGTEDYFARQVVLERLRDVELPGGVEPTLAPLTTPTGELYRYVLEGPGHDEMELRELQDWVVTPRFLQEPGIADVSTFGGLVKQYQIEIDPLALEKYNISIGQIARAVGANNQNAGGALLDNRQQSLVVRGLGLIHSTQDIEDTVLAATRGVPVYVRDVGRVRIGPAVQTGIFGLDSRSGGVEGIVLMRRGENPSEVLKGVEEAVEDLNSTRLPAGVRLAPLYNRSELVRHTLKTVSHTLLEGLTIVLAVLLFFLGSVEAALLTALIIPLSLLFAFLCMYLCGIPASLLSLGALDFGIIVDGTVVMVECILRGVRTGSDRRPGESVLAAAQQVARPILFSLMILIAAYLPLFTLQRTERRLFTPMAVTICAALIGSLLFALTLVPAAASWLFRNGARTWKNPLLTWGTAFYERELMRALRRPGASVCAVGAVVFAAVTVACSLGTEFLPQLDEGVIWIRANLPPGISLAKSAEVASDIRDLVRKSPEVRAVASQSGRVDSGTDPFGPNRNELLVTLAPYSEWGPGRTKRALVEELSKRLHDNIPGADFNFTQPIIDMVTESVTGSSADLAVILNGPDLVRLRKLAQQGLGILRSVPGAADTAIEQEADQAQLRIQLDRRALARYGLNVEDVQDLIELAVGGKAVSTLLDGERRFDITVRYVPEARTDSLALSNILVHTPEGGKVPLSQLALLRVSNGASIIARRENQRQITVRTNIRGRDQGSFVSQAQELFAKRVKLPNGYSITWGGQFENLERARKRLAIILPITIGLIFALLYFAFGSLKDAALILLTVPFSMTGGVAALKICGINFSVSAAVGFVSLFGVAVMGGVLFVSEMRRGQDMPLGEAVVAGASSQLRPLLMLIVVAMLGMMPAALASGIGSDIQRPLATVVVGGLASTLLLSLMALPSCYYLMHRGE